jgi:hypothetical protein
LTKKEAVKNWLKGQHNTIFYTDEKGRRRAIRHIDEVNKGRLEGILASLQPQLTEAEQTMQQNGIKPAGNVMDTEGHVIEVSNNGQVEKYRYDPDKVSREQAKQDVQNYVKLATSVAEIAALLAA